MNFTSVWSRHSEQYTDITLDLSHAQTPGEVLRTLSYTNILHAVIVIIRCVITEHHLQQAHPRFFTLLSARQHSASFATGTYVYDSVVSYILYVCLQDNLLSFIAITNQIN